MAEYSIVRSELELQRADHISWPTGVASGAPVHHAIVVSHEGGKNFRLIHVRARNAGPRTVALCGASDAVISEDVRDLQAHMDGGQLRRYIYDAKQCRQPAEVIKAARSQRGSFDFSALENNCEHFARWCKARDTNADEADNGCVVS